MVDVNIVNETSPEANWNRRTDGQAGKPMCWEAAPPKIFLSRLLYKQVMIVSYFAYKNFSLLFLPYMSIFLDISRV